MEIALLAFFTAGYLVLSGADFGIGMLLPYLGRSPGERGRVLDVITPFFLADEVWLVVAVGFFAGAFPVLEGGFLAENYAAFTVLLLGWVARDAGILLRGRVDRAAWRTGCEAAVVIGSWAVALSWGFVLAGSTGSAGAAPPVLAAAVAAAAALFCAQGLALAALRLRGETSRAETGKASGGDALRTETGKTSGGEAGVPWRRARRPFGALGERAAYALTSAAIVSAGLAAGSRLPLAEHLADPATLALLTPAAAILTPLLVGTQVWLWRVLARPGAGTARTAGAAGAAGAAGTTEAAGVAGTAGAAGTATS
ncbi:cytochrome d ubiquinol oxidase subunit II [Planomonospora sp. ID82291]|uniref:cytochrome d ubiquinol oxidase subunit II n=1 Tax=Planomonospora sp. ID82291 TaxID=2738136 RepID=UPI001A1DBF77|nr:cytochrome d ubiquinol oxidase subunit II [Planomonospora sp. ID82291]MBG0814820.1 cytochrome d ubiquinol oxidase subunit II [Planomonospora sp. ID82291]